MKITVEDIKKEAMLRAGNASSVGSSAVGSSALSSAGLSSAGLSPEDADNLMFELRNFDKIASEPDDLLLMYAKLVKEAQYRAKKRLGIENGLSLR